MAQLLSNTSGATMMLDYKIEPPRNSEWKCYLFGARPDRPAMVYVPAEGCVPNWFVRWMMKICLGCTWVKAEHRGEGEE